MFFLAATGRVTIFSLAAIFSCFRAPLYPRLILGKWSRSAITPCPWSA